MEIANDQKAAPAFSRVNPFLARVTLNKPLTKPSSNKETRHLELSIEGSAFSYKPGDCLGIFPENDPALVSALLNEMNWDPDTVVMTGKEEAVTTLSQALTSYYEITLLTKKIIRQATAFSDHPQIHHLAEHASNDELKAYIEGRDFLDFVRDFGPWHATAEQMIGLLRKMPPRLYSIASSQTVHPDEVHLTIGAVRYEAHGRQRDGVCSVQCAERAGEGSVLPVFIQPNKHFYLPDQETDVIMIGPGTGIAPFRSFLEEMDAQGWRGKGWLFFGDQHEATDFLYEEELKRWLDTGVLARLDTAFSRDGSEKVYVQHRMQEQRTALYEKIQQGAFIYVCGDKHNMAKDVHDTLIAIIASEGGKTYEEAEAYLDELKKAKRYQRDVY